MTLKLLNSLLAVVVTSCAPLLAADCDLLDVRDVQDAPVIANKEFEVCRSCDNWEIKDNKLVISSLSGISVSFDL